VRLREQQWVVLPIHGNLEINKKIINIQHTKPFMISGRKRICIVFCFTMISALLLRLVNQYVLLFLSHVLSGLSTAGILANTWVNIWGFKAPYVCSMLLVGLVGFMVTTTWTENYGSSRFVSLIYHLERVLLKALNRGM
jgi:hypothetical protein